MSAQTGLRRRRNLIIEDDDEPLIPQQMTGRSQISLGDVDDEPPASQPIHPYRMDDTSYYGDRTTSRGTVVKDYLVTQAITRLHTNTEALPVFEYNNPSGIVLGKKVPRSLISSCEIDAKRPNQFSLFYEIPEDNVIIGNNVLRFAAAETKEYNRPLVFLVTSNAPHAMIYIINEGLVYSVGFGFYDDMFQQKMSKVLQRFSETWAHRIETLDGALYSADFLMPNVSQGGKIVWVGFLDDEIFRRIENDVKQTAAIIYSGTISADGTYTISNKCTLLTPKCRYCEGAGFMKNGASNCLIWAQSKLNVNINCGFKGTPDECHSITPDELNAVIQNSGPELVKVVKDIQRRIEPVDICTRISRSLGLCGGTRRRKNMKRKNKNKKSNKRSNKKTRKNKRKH